MRCRVVAISIALAACAAFGAEKKYHGPVPPKPDVVYLVHADNLLPAEIASAKSDERGNQITHWIANAASPVRTPLAEPIFLIDAQKIVPEKMEVYRFEVKNGRRQLVFSKKPNKNDPQPLRLKVTQVEGKLYRIEANETLDNGEYGLSPAGGDQVFAFQVY